MKKVMEINSCRDCPYLVKPESKYVIYYCAHCIVADPPLPNAGRVNFPDEEIPGWCPLSRPVTPEKTTASISTGYDPSRPPWHPPDMPPLTGEALAIENARIAFLDAQPGVDKVALVFHAGVEWARNNPILYVPKKKDESE